MRLTLDSLTALDAIARKGSFAAAAEELHRVPSALTYTVHKLEQDLGVQVFDRSGHRARLTPVGQMLLDEGRHLLRAANELERTAKRMATGWEAELNIAVGDLIPLECFYPLIEAFYEEQCSTRLHFSSEALAGTWEALLSGRADLVVGASGEGPTAGGYAAHSLGTVAFAFVVAAHHPLANVADPLPDELILRHRAVAIADSSRHLPALTSALFDHQEVLTVPNMEAKCEALRRGLGVGYVPRYRVQTDLDSGGLIAKQVMGTVPHPQLCIAWRPGRPGKALKWFFKRLEESRWFDGILE